METLKTDNPKIYEQFVAYANKLENHYGDMQDIEFTIERGDLYILQTRNGKRTALAAINIAVDLVNEGKCSKEEALLKIDPKQLNDLLHPMFDKAAAKEATVVASGLPASPGAAVGKIAFTAEEAVARAEKGEKVILVRLETSPEDIEGMDVAKGILTARGGLTSHAAVVARGMGRCCIVGCGDLQINEHKKTLTIKGKTYGEKDTLSIDGSTGNVCVGAIPTVEPEIGGNFGTIMSWANAVRTLKVRANADSPKDAKTALEFGAEGIGLCRTEHMFFEKDRIKSVREMIIAKTEHQRRVALAKLLPMQKQDFIGIYKEMKGLPVTIRFLDPPLHEFLQLKDDEKKEVAKDLGISLEDLDSAIADLHEFNPMMGHRGCRLSVTFPEIAVMQTRAVIEAAIEVNKAGGSVVPEIMIPLIGDVKELKYVKDYVVSTAEEVMEEAGVKVEYMVGTMIEIPRAAITADKVASEAEFFSFGTNDLTQMTYGFSRDDAGKFLTDYYSKKIFESDPFERVDQEGVGALMKMACEKGKAVRKNIKLGICGEHGGDPSTVEFCHNIGLTYVSCSPFRVPIAILAAAHAAIKDKKK
jgi:pyruvate,orthophosphate dikinase